MPIALQNLLISGVNLVDTIMVGRLGSTAIAAVGLANQVYFLMLLLLFGIGSGAAVFTAQYWGKGDVAGVRRSVGLSLAIGMVAAAFYTIAAVGFPEFVMGLYSGDRDVVAAGAPYLRAVGISYIPTAITFIFSLALRSVERVKLPLAATVMSLGVNVGLNYALIFGKWGFPELGVLGAGIATTVARSLEMIVVLGGTYLRRYAPAGSPREFLASDWPFVRRFAIVALPVVVNEVAWSLGMTVHSAIFARVSTEAAAAYNILQTVLQVANVVFIGTANAAAVMIGKKIGEGELATSREWAGRFARMAPLLGVGMSLLLVPARFALGFLFDVDPGTLDQARAMLLVLACFFPAKVFNLHFVVGIGRAGGDTRFGMFFDIFGVWMIGVPAAAAAAFWLGLPPWAIYAGALSEELAKSFLGAARLKSGKWLRSVA